VPSVVWADIGIDFIEPLPKVQGKTVILSVVDRFSKYCNFIPLAHPYTTESVAHAFFADIVRLHGVPQSIVSDRDPVFTSVFWQELMRLTGMKLYMSSAFHPQTDGQTEAANRVIVMYLRCFTDDHPRQWLRWLPWAEYMYNTAYQSSLRDTPFRVVYGWDPRPSALMSPARPVSQRLHRRWKNVQLSSTTSAIALNKHRRFRSASTTSTIDQCPSRSAIGLSFAFDSGQQHPFHAQQQGSSSRGTSGVPSDGAHQ
jgi:hypothetical protein